MLCPPDTTCTQEYWGFCVGSLSPSGSQMSHFGWGLQLETDFRSVTTTSQKSFCLLWSGPAPERLWLNGTAACKSQISLPALQTHTRQVTMITIMIIIFYIFDIIVPVQTPLCFCMSKFLIYEHSDPCSPSQGYDRKVSCSIFSFSCSLPPWCCGNLHWSSFNVLESALKINFGNYSLQMITRSNISQ